MQLNGTADQVACLPDKFAGQSLIKDRTLQNALVLISRTYYEQ